MSGEFQAFSQMYLFAFSSHFTQLHEFLDRRQLKLLQKSDERRAEIDSLDEKVKELFYKQVNYDLIG